MNTFRIQVPELDSIPPDKTCGVTPQQLKMAECCAVELGGEEGGSASPGANTALPQPAFTASLRPVQELSVGFTCTFIDAPKELRTECPICLFILREPHQATCCGSIYCKMCIEHVRNDRKPCPTCRDANFDVFLDRGLRNSLYGFKVSCIQKDQGCTWLGELRYMEDHLNVNPKPEKRFFGCEYVSEPCTACGSSIPRGMLEEHEMKKCPKRLYTCEYCSDYNATFEEVAEKHWVKCPNRSVPCTNECGVYPLNKNLEHHLKYECDLRKPDPESNSPIEIRRLIESTVKSQLSAMATEFLKKAIQEEIGKEQEVASELRDTVKDLKQVKEDSKQLRAELDKLKSEQARDRESVMNLKAHFCIVPVTFTLDNYKSRRLRSDRGWSSPCFYTSPRGYRMCLLVDVGGPASQNEALFVSVYLSIAKGDFDSQLKWPFRGAVTISLLSQEPDKMHHVEVIKYHDNTHLASSGRVKAEDPSKPWGKGKFIRHDQLEQGGFVLNDELKFEVSKVTLDF